MSGSPDKQEPRLLWLHVSTCALSGAITIVSCYLAVREFRRSQYEWAHYCLAVLLGPSGALVRWQLSRLNALSSGASLYVECPPAMHGHSTRKLRAVRRSLHELARPHRAGWQRWCWLPLGTLLANLIGCAMAYVLEDVQQQLALDATARTVLASLQTGFVGSLSTVSTWAAEVRATLVVARAFAQTQRLIISRPLIHVYTLPADVCASHVRHAAGCACRSRPCPTTTGTTPWTRMPTPPFPSFLRSCLVLPCTRPPSCNVPSGACCPTCARRDAHGP